MLQNENEKGELELSLQPVELKTEDKRKAGAVDTAFLQPVRDVEFAAKQIADRERRVQTPELSEQTPAAEPAADGEQANPLEAGADGEQEKDDLPF